MRQTAFLILKMIRIRRRHMLLLERRRMQIRTRNTLRTIALCLPETSSWSYLKERGDDSSFISALGLNRRGFYDILLLFQTHYVHRYGTELGGRPSKIDTTQALAMILQFYASSVEYKTLAQLHGCSTAVVGRVIQKAEIALSKSLGEHPLAGIKWPKVNVMRQWAARVEAKYPLLKGKFGFVDGKNFRVQKPSDIDLQNAQYNGWLHATLITGVLCFGVDGCLIWGKHNCVGSWNDADMSRELQDKLMLVPDGLGIVSDTAFPASKELVGKICSPLKDGELEKAHPDVQGLLLRLSSDITSLRQACEWGMGSVEKPFRQLSLPLPYNPVVRETRLTNLFRLFNLRVRTTGISQIRSVFFD